VKNVVLVAIQCLLQMASKESSVQLVLESYF
jgi:hypothetical protein